MPNLSNPFVADELPKALQNRISAHSKHSDFNLHNRLIEAFPLKNGDRVLDLGCGNGNYTDLFWSQIAPQGSLLGIDKNPALVKEAQERHAAKGDKVQFFVGDFDQPLSIPVDSKKSGAGFDWVFSIYSLYYVDDSKRIVDEIYRRLTPGGRFVVVGPGPKNGLDLMQLNSEWTQKGPNEKILGHINRIADEFRFIFENRFGIENTAINLIDSTMTFPGPQDFADYYWATLLWRESTEDLDTAAVEDIKTKVTNWASANTPIKIGKQVVFLTGNKK